MGAISNHSEDIGTFDKTAERKMTAQSALSVEADFGERTWTFRLGPGMMVAAGAYYIVPKDEYEQMKEFAASSSPAGENK